MPSLVLCYAAADRETARALGGLIENSLPFDISYGECVIDPASRPGFDLVDAAERALSAEAALVLLSPDSVPKKWRRDRWEPVFFEKRVEFQTNLACVLVRECVFPELLRRERFFDLSHGLPETARRIRRWLLHPGTQVSKSLAASPEAEELQAQIADAPGIAEVASAGSIAEFVDRCSVDFEAIHRIDCRNRSRAGLLGDIGYCTGLTLPGTVEENTAALRLHLERRRFLFILENLPYAVHELAGAMGKSSVIVTQSKAQTVALNDLERVFFASPRDEARCFSLLGAAWTFLTESLSADFEAGLRFGWAMVSVLELGKRIAETLEVLDVMHRAASREDAWALYRIEWELSWLRDRGPDAETRILPLPPAENTQLTLF